MRDIDPLYDALGRVLAAAENHQQAADRSIQAMNKASANLEHKANTLDGQLSREMTRAMDLAVADAAKALTAQFKTAHELAKQAETRYRNSVRWAAWKVFATATIFGVVLILSTAYLIQGTIPSYTEIEALRSEKAYLTKNISELERRGGRVNLSPCSDESNRRRLCVKIDEQAGAFQNGYRVIAGY